MNLIEIFVILFIHWVADFVCQTEKQAMNKSHDNWKLLEHVATYTLVWYLALALYGAFIADITMQQALFALVVTFVAHYYTDYITSRVNSRLWKQKRTHDFFVSIGFDQLLHYTQLFLVFYYFIKKN